MQVTGVDYKKNFASNASNTTTRMILIITMYFGNEEWICESVNVEATFLEGYNSGLQNMEWPTGTVTLGFATKEEVIHRCLQMLRSIYENKKAALMFYTAYTQHRMKELGMTKSLTNSCAFYKKAINKIVLIVSYHVDNTLIAGQLE